METKIVQGGIYIEKEYPKYFYMYCKGLLHIFRNGKVYNSIDSDVMFLENFNTLTLLEGYKLISVHIEFDIYEWQIRHSGLKNTDKYIIGRGFATEKFFNQVANM